MIDLTFKKDYSKTTQPIDSINDSEWLKTTFIMSDSELDKTNEYKKWIKKNRYRSSADYKFTCTSPGMNFSVNPKPQFTRYADIRSPGKLVNSRGKYITPTTLPGKYGLGMGRYYSEAVDDTAQRVFFRFGVPSFKPLAIFVSQAFDIQRTVLANRGSITSIALKVVDWVSTIFVVAAFPFISLGMGLWRMASTNSRFYCVDTRMYVYWSTVEDILNTFVARRTLLPHILPNYSNKLDNKIGQEITISSTFIDNLNKLIPDVIDSKGRISVWGLALKAQTVFNKIQEKDYKDNEGKNLSKDFTDYPLNGESVHDTYFTNRHGNASTYSTMLNWLFNKANEAFGNNNELMVNENTSQKDLLLYDDLYTDENGKPIDINIDPNDQSDSISKRIETNFKNKESKWNKFRDYVTAEFTEGASFAVFTVEHTGSVSESFSNSFTTNPIEATFNSLSSKARSLTSMLGGATEMPIVGDIMKLAADAGAIITSNASFGLANPILAMMYGVNVEIGKIWESSSVSLPRASYKLKLISPGGDAYSQLFNQYLPLSMIYAGALARSTGSASHTSPFACQVFDRGRINTSFGMIESCTVTRGTSNLAFSKSGHPNAIDVDFTVASLDDMVSVDIASGGILSNDVNALFSVAKNTPFNDYINTVTGLDVYHQVTGIPKLRLAFSEIQLKFNKYVEIDPAAFAAFTVNKLPFENMIVKSIFGNNAGVLVDLTKGL